MGRVLQFQSASFFFNTTLPAEAGFFIIAAVSREMGLNCWNSNNKPFSPHGSFIGKPSYEVLNCTLNS